MTNSFPRTSTTKLKLYEVVYHKDSSCVKRLIVAHRLSDISDYLEECRLSNDVISIIQVKEVEVLTTETLNYDE